MNSDFLPDADAETSFNGFVAACLIHALEATGVLDALAEGPRTIDELTKSLGITQSSHFLAVLRASSWLGIVKLSGEGTVSLGFSDIASKSGFFTWVVGGYGNTMATLPELLVGKKDFGVDIRRRENWVARGAGVVGRKLVRPDFLSALAGLKFQRVVDLGCGDGSRLIDLSLADQSVTGIGIEISADAAGLARRNVEVSGLASRIRIIQGNALAPGEKIPCDLVMSFFLLHDLIQQRGSIESVIEAFRETYSVHTYMLADTVVGDRGAPPPLFSAAFELLHSIMEVPLYSRSVYEAGFSRAGLQIETTTQLRAPNSWLWILRDIGGQ